MADDSYQKAGIDYSKMDPSKISAQQAAGSTSGALHGFGFKEVSASRGESAYVWDQGDSYGAFVIEGLGTKSLIADAVRSYTKRTHYDQLAQDTIAMIVNDLIVVGALPTIVNAYWAVGDSSWHDDRQRIDDLIRGWQHACQVIGATWGGGETPTLKNIIKAGTIDLGGAAIGIIQNKKHLVLGEQLQAGDHVVLIESSGVHANGITLARAVADELPDGYATKIGDTTYGEGLLQPTHLYVGLLKELQAAHTEIHYMANITGHGWRKLMRAPAEFTYRFHQTPPVSALFDFIQKHSKSTLRDMYGNYNMGAGYALFVPPVAVSAVMQAAENHSFRAWDAGVVETGPRQVIIEPHDITFSGETLGVRAA